MEKWVGAFAASVEEFLYKGGGGKELNPDKFIPCEYLDLVVFFRYLQNNPAKGCKWLKYLAVTNENVLSSFLFDPVQL